MPPDDPWERFAALHGVGERLRAPITNITDFGIFVALDTGIDGLVHLSDISWTELPGLVIRCFRKGQEIEVVVLAIDVDRQRISLGIKQVQENPRKLFAKKYRPGDIVSGHITLITRERMMVRLQYGVTGVIRIRGAEEEDSDSHTHWKWNPGEKVEAEIVSMDVERCYIRLAFKNQGDDSLYMPGSPPRRPRPTLSTALDLPDRNQKGIH